MGIQLFIFLASWCHSEAKQNDLAIPSWIVLLMLASSDLERFCLRRKPVLLFKRIELQDARFVATRRKRPNWSYQSHLCTIWKSNPTRAVNIAAVKLPLWFLAPMAWLNLLDNGSPTEYKLSISASRWRAIVWNSGVVCSVRGRKRAIQLQMESAALGLAQMKCLVSGGRQM